mmetsp:Transcript_16767/g.25836  ORF Transcript_16767/g.25836 Transcript_16767/m.25836 type:complete len:153 (-) Transcript_16767:712-1170(-)
MAIGGPYSRMNPLLDLSLMQMLREKGGADRLSKFEKPKSLKTHVGKSWDERNAEFKFLTPFFPWDWGAGVTLMNKPNFRKNELDVYCNVSPFFETGVILKRNKFEPFYPNEREAFDFNSLKDEHYINACHIKTAFGETAVGGHEPFGHLIAT